jgi:signal transduction histidine kinase
MLSQRTNNFLFQSRIVFLSGALLFLLYSAAFLWFYIPFGGPLFRWEEGGALIIEDVPEANASLLLPGDVVKSIGDQPVIRGRPYYPLPLSAVYDFTILRDEETLVVAVPVYASLNAVVVSRLLPSMLLSFTSFFVGAIMLFWAQPKNYQALHIGYIFLLASVVLMGIQASLGGVPGAWVAQSLIFPLAVGWVFLGFMPSEATLPVAVERSFNVMLLAAFGLTAAMLFEAFVLFPQSTDFEVMVGIGTYELGFLLSAVGLLSCVFLLVWRAWRLPHGSYMRRQLTILLWFFAIGAFPSVLLTILPRVLLGDVVLPFPIAISLLIFIPSGYFFVVYRKGLLGLDLFFSRVIYLVLLSLFMFGVYAGGLFLVQRWLMLEGRDALLPSVVVFFPAFLLSLYAGKPLSEFVQRMMYGDYLYDDTLARITQGLSKRPEMTSLEAAIDIVFQAVGVSQGVMVFQRQRSSPSLVKAVGVEAVPLPDEFPIHLTEPVLRSSLRLSRREADALAHFPWSEILIPLVLRDKQVGLLVLARPGPEGYFNNHQVMFLIQVAGILAVSSDNIILFELARSFARRALVVREQERMQLAARIHDDPLQLLTRSIDDLEEISSFAEQKAENQTARLIWAVIREMQGTARKIREICEGLYPFPWEQNVGLAVSDIVLQFKQQTGLDIDLEIQDVDSVQVAHDVSVSTCHIVRECLNNVIKHADGASAQIALKWTSETLELVVTDNGPGSDLAHLSYSDLLEGHHLGVVGMHEWSKLVNGSLHISENRPTGVRVMFVCPANQMWQEVFNLGSGGGA